VESSKSRFHREMILFSQRSMLKQLGILAIPTTQPHRSMPDESAARVACCFEDSTRIFINDHSQNRHQQT
jgi:hypothetical protein